MTLALVIPVHDDAEVLARLLRQAERLAVFDQLVICDDGSRVAVTTDLVPLALRPRTRLLRHNTARGAGGARNAALTVVQTTHLLFFDADDLLTPELPALWRDLGGLHFDLCLFRHHDSRRAGLGGWGQMPEDDLLWRRAGMGGAALREMEDPARAHLAETANYPWNKIYRTGFLRDHGIGCAALEMHEDVELHWRSLLLAERVLASDRIAAQHFVVASGQRLSNRRDAARLAAFASFARVAEEIGAARGASAPLYGAYMRFISGLALWMRGHLQADLHPRLEAETGAFLRRFLEPETLRLLAGQDLAAARRMVLQMTGGRPVAEDLAPFLDPGRGRLVPPPASGLAPLSARGVALGPVALGALYDRVRVS